MLICIRMQIDYPEQNLTSTGHKPQYKSRYIKSDRRESGEQLWIHCHKSQISERNTNSSGTKTINYQMVPHETEKLL